MFVSVLGRDQEHGHLWFMLDKDIKEGVSFWDDIVDYDTMICKGVLPLVSKVPVFQPVTSLVNDACMPKMFSHIRDVSVV